jgi:hypothetical protein
MSLVDLPSSSGQDIFRLPFSQPSTSWTNQRQPARDAVSYPCSWTPPWGITNLSSFSDPIRLGPLDAMSPLADHEQNDVVARRRGQQIDGSQGPQRTKGYSGAISLSPFQIPLAFPYVYCSYLHWSFGHPYCTVSLINCS